MGEEEAVADLLSKTGHLSSISLLRDSSKYKSCKPQSAQVITFVMERLNSKRQYSVEGVCILASIILRILYSGMGRTVREMHL